MKKRSAIILAVVLSLAMLIGIGCTAVFASKSNSGSNPSDASSFDTNGETASSNVLLNQSPTVTIGVYAPGMTSNEVARKVSVKDAFGNLVDFDIVEGGNSNYGIVSVDPYGAGSYTIAVSDGVTFSDSKYKTFESIDLIIQRDEVDNIDLKDNVITFAQDEYRQVDGSTVAISQDKDVAIGSPIVLVGEKEKQSAYIVESISRNGGGLILGVKDAEADQIFNSIDVKKDVAMLEGNIELDEAALIEQLEQGNISALVIDLGFAKPTITVENFGLDLANGKVTIDIVFRVPLDGSGYTSFEIRVANVIKVDPSVDFSTAPFSFNLTAKMNVGTTTTFKISAGYSQSGMYDASELAKKLEGLIGKPINEAALKVFKWSYPIGPLFISYELDFFFNVTIYGEARLDAYSEANYVLGAYFNDGKFKAIAEKGETKPFTVTNAELYGSALMNAGIRNTLSLELLQIVHVGIQIDLGAYLDIYGAVKFNLTDIAQSAAGVYLDFGLFYDVGVLAGCDLFGLISINEKINIAYGRLQLIELGNKVMNLDYTDDIKNVVITSKSSVLPELSMKKYNLINRGTYTEKVPYNDNTYTLPQDAYFTLDESGVVTVLDNAPEYFEQNITVALKKNPQINHILTVKKISNVPHAVNDILTYDKSANNQIIFEVELRGGAFERISGEGIVADNFSYSGNRIIIDSRFFAAKANGIYRFTVENTKANFEVFVRVQGTISLFAEGEGTAEKPYLIYSQEQMLEFITNSSLNSNYNGRFIKLDANVDMRGAAVAPITIFEGTLNGNGYKVSNFSISSVEYGGETLGGLVGINRGTIFNLSIAADVNVNARQAKVGMIAAINDGNILNVKAEGNINVSYKTTASRHADLVVGGMVGVNNKTLAGSSNFALTVAGSINVNVTGTSIYSTVYAANLAGINNGNINQYVMISNSLNCAKKIGLKIITNSIAN